MWADPRVASGQCRVLLPHLQCEGEVAFSSRAHTHWRVALALRGLFYMLHLQIGNLLAGESLTKGPRASRAGRPRLAPWPQKRHTVVTPAPHKQIADDSH
eukprot:scaffold28048_cov60-Phaeocystis_antarctica.AAC.3